MPCDGVILAPILDERTFLKTVNSHRIEHSAAPAGDILMRFANTGSLPFSFYAFSVILLARHLPAEEPKNPAIPPPAQTLDARLRRVDRF